MLKRDACSPPSPPPQHNEDYVLHKLTSPKFNIGGLGSHVAKSRNTSKDFPGQQGWGPHGPPDIAGLQFPLSPRWPSEADAHC